MKRKLRGSFLLIPLILLLRKKKWKKLLIQSNLIQYTLVNLLNMQEDELQDNHTIITIIELHL